MAELLFELLSEEIPARMQEQAAADLKRLVIEKLNEKVLSFSRAQSFATPRRLALVVDGLPVQQPDQCDEKRGPRVGAPEAAVQGFLKSAGLTSLDQCKTRDTGKGEFYFAVQMKAGLPTYRVLPELLWDTINEMPWPKSMRWANTEFRWVRPLHNILAVFDGEPLVLDFDLIRTKAMGYVDSVSDGIARLVELKNRPDAKTLFRTLEATNRTYGHRFVKYISDKIPYEISVTSFSDYQEKLYRSYVVLDSQERRRRIKADAEQLASEKSLKLRVDPGLIEEIAGLVEWPVALIGAIDGEFLNLPPEVMTASMRAHQRYLALEDEDGKLADHFIVIANMLTDDGGKAIVAGNERVLRARLFDAKFFWDQDRKTALVSLVPKLNDIVFHAKLGTVAEKVERITALSVELAHKIPYADVDLVRSAATLCKADLTTGMVGEFPELQGIIGLYYALADGEHPLVADAIRDHYAPQGPSDRCPVLPVSIAVALADKIDSLAGFFTIGEKPTGSKDPFALRRAALGVIRLILENKLRLPLCEHLKSALIQVDRVIHTVMHRNAGAATITDVIPTPQMFEAAINKTCAEILDFFADRLKVHLKEKGVRHDLVTAVFALGDEDDLVRLLARVDALGRFIGTEDGANLLVAYKRAANILRIEEKKDGRSYRGEADVAKAEIAEEKSLVKVLGEIAKALETALSREDFEGAMAALALLRAPVDKFFDHVTVNAEDKGLRENRLKLLSQIVAGMNKLADFSKIEG